MTLIDSAQDHFHCFIRLAAFAGLRAGEIRGLQVRDINFFKHELYVSRQTQTNGKRTLDVRAPKSGKTRVVPLPDELVILLAEHIRQHCPGTDIDRWLFPNVITPSTYQGHWYATCERAKLSIRFHDLRHFYASALIANGCQVTTVQRLLGHGSAKITLDVYAHLWPGWDDHARDAITRTMTGLFPDAQPSDQQQ